MQMFEIGGKNRNCEIERSCWSYKFIDLSITKREEIQIHIDDINRFSAKDMGFGFLQLIKKEQLICLQIYPILNISRYFC